MRRITLILLMLTALLFLMITIKRLTMDYNENGVYFDGEVSYDRDSAVALGAIAIVFAIITMVVFIVTKKNRLP